MERKAYFKISKYDVEIEICVGNGIWEFDSRSGTGKTYLCNTLKEYMLKGEPVLGYAYSDYKNGVDIDALLKSKPKLIMIDRYDQFKDALNEKLIKASKEAIVLVDYKRGMVCNDVGFCDIELEPSKIRIVLS